MALTGSVFAQSGSVVDGASPLKPAISFPEAGPVQAVRLEAGEKISLDGSLSHPAWQRVKTYDQFIQVNPNRGQAAAYATRFKVLFDEQAIYIGIEALDPKPELIQAPQTRFDQVYRVMDFVVVYIDAIGDKKSAQFFRINANGVTADGLHTSENDNEDFSPDYEFQANAQKTTSGFTAVLRVPFTSLRFDPNSKKAWRIQVGRRTPRDDNYLSLSVALPQESQSFIDRLQPLEGLTPPSTNSFLWLRPSLTARSINVTGSGKEQTLKPSLDFKWGPRSELVIDGTLNPDFSQLEVDEVALTQNNRFALFKQEKRTLFLESRDILSSPSDAIYTRSLTDPRWALRATWREASLSGTAMAINDKGGGLVLLPGPFYNDAATQPAHNSIIVRALRDNYGALLMQRTYEDQRGSNTVGGVDANLKLGEVIRARLQVLASSTSALPDYSSGQAELKKGSSQQGAQFNSKFNGNTKTFDQFYELNVTSSKFRNDSGFTSQSGVTYAGAEWTWKRFDVPMGTTNQSGTPWFNANQVNTYVSAGYTRDNETGKAVSAYLTPGIYLEGPYGAELNTQLRLISKNRSEANAPLMHERYLFMWGQITPPSPLFKLIQGNVNIGHLSDFSANIARPGIRWNAFLRLRPSDRIEIEPNYNQTRLGQVFDERSLQILGIFHIQPRHAMRWIGQFSDFKRQAEPQYGTSRSQGSRKSQSLTYIWRESYSNALYVGYSQSESQGSPRVRELYLKWQRQI
jgi:hypothetical protein